MLIILSTHPIQYQVPMWQALARDGRVPFEVWYVTDRHTRLSHDREFDKTFAWDIEMLEGYPSRFLHSVPDATPSAFWECRLTEDLAVRLRNAGARALWLQGWQVFAYWQAIQAARRAGVELWMRGESNDLKPISGMKRWAKQLILGQLFRRVDHFLFIGRANRRFYEMHGVPATRLHLTPYAVDNERFSRQADELRPDRMNMRRQWGIPDDAFCVLFCGKFVPKKRPSDIIEAMRLLRASGRIPKLHLLFVGSGELGHGLRRECTIAFDAEGGGLQANPRGGEWRPLATFAGFLNQKEISKAYVAADCLVLPSDSGETWGLVVNEAMASGLPCAASRACGCTEDLISARWPERAFDLGDHAGLGSAVAAIQNAVRSADTEQLQVAEYSIQVTLDKIARLYEAIPANRIAP